MALYEKPVRHLFKDMVRDLGIQKGEVIERKKSIHGLKQTIHL